MNKGAFQVTRQTTGQHHISMANPISAPRVKTPKNEWNIAVCSAWKSRDANANLLKCAEK
jgi:hypothetical protein